MIAIELTLGQLIAAVRQLSPDQKLELNDAIWADEFSIPMEHQKIVNERIVEYRANPSILLDWDLASKDLKG